MVVLFSYGSPDDWEHFQHYLGCLLDDESSVSIVTDSNPTCTLKSVAFKILHLPDEVFHTRISRADTFILKLISEDNNAAVRCLYLAKLEIERRKQTYRKGDVITLVEGLADYYSRFGHLDCFASDIESFMEVLDYQAKSELLEKISTVCGYTTSSPTKALGLSMTLYRIRNLVGNVFSLSFCELEALAAEMAVTYFKNLPLSKDLDVQENMYGEDLLSMTCNVLVQLFWRTRNTGYLLESIMILEFGLTVRRFIYQYKILLVHLYSFWGCIPIAYERL